jgi:site-specific recombinase XerD
MLPPAISAGKEHSMTVPDSWTLDALVEAFEQHLRRARGLRDQTLHGYARLVRLLIREALGDDPIDVRRLGPADVIGFVRGMTGRFSPRSMKAVGTALRSFFRFLRTEGVGDERLDAAIPRVAFWRLSTLPRCLSDEQLDQLLTSFASDTPCARRDRAIVLCLSTLGLRPGEAAHLHLEDIDWRRGVVHLRTRKTRRGAVLPLPRDSGRAIVDYLRHERPKTDERRVFVQHFGRGRGAPISSAVVSAAVTRALRRAGIDSPLEGAYVFRHTVASRMVRRGTSLKEVADFLGHRCLDTTTIYAKLDVPALREVALPWPEVTP